jgi:hypothetical protein
MKSKIASRRAGRELLVGAVMTTLALAVTSAMADISQSGEQRNMRRVGHTDLQGRAAYQPNTIQYPDGRTIAFVGTHSGAQSNPLKGNVVEENGTMIVDVTDPDRPVEKFHIPGTGGGQSQMARMCLGTHLDGTSNVYLMRNVQGGTGSGFEVWNVSNVNAPVFVGAMRGIRSTHKLWWECSTGIAYLPGSLDTAAGFPLWRQAQSMVIANWKDPAHPQYLRTHGLAGGQPSGTGAVPPSLHGPISAHDHPNAAGMLARARTASDVIGNRVYTAWGVGDDGVIQVLDRQKLLPPPFGTYSGSANDPTDAQLLAPQVSVLYMSPDQGGHTSMPVFGVTPRSFENFLTFKTRDIVIVTSEATSNKCQEAPHAAFLADFTVENSLTAPPGTRVETNPWQGPMVLSSMWVDPHSGERYKRGNYCDRGARYGSHSSEENFRNPYYGKLTFLTYFTGGVRVWDIREPMTPREVGFYVPVSNANTTPDGYMSNNVEVDNRGFVYVVDRNGAGLDILRVTGQARRIAFENDPAHDGDDD